MSVEDFKRFRPTCGFIVIQREQPPPSVGAIHLVAKSADENRKVPAPARVIRLGDPDRCPKTDRHIPFSVREGDRIMVDSFAGHDIELDDGTRYVFIGEAEILCVIPDDAVVGTQVRTMPVLEATE